MISISRMRSNWHNTALSTDMRVQVMCKNFYFVFIDNWIVFYCKIDYHTTDEIHLNHVGAK